MAAMRNVLLFSIKLAVTVAILTAIAFKLDVRVLLADASILSPYGIIAALVLIVLQMVVAALRLCSIMRLYGYALAWTKAFRITLESLFFAQTFISFIGSDSVRIWRVHKQGVALSEAAAAITLDRLLGIIVNHACLLVSLPFAFSVITDQRVRFGLLVLALAGAGGVALVIALAVLRGRTGFSERLIGRLNSTPIVPILLEMASVGKHLIKPRPQLLVAAALSIAMVILNCAIFFAILCAWDVPALIAFQCALLVPGVLEVAMLPISIAGWGIREGVVIFAFGTLGVPASTALGTSVVYALLLLSVGLIGGVIWLLDRQARRVPGIERRTDTP
jgi:glycosyltransferase 2 family protein